MHIWTAPFCVVCLLFALAWACCPFVSGAILRHVSAPCFDLGLLPFCLLATQSWRGHLVAREGSWVCISGRHHFVSSICASCFSATVCPLVFGRASVAGPFSGGAWLAGVGISGLCELHRCVSSVCLFLWPFVLLFWSGLSLLLAWPLSGGLGSCVAVRLVGPLCPFVCPSVCMSGCLSMLPLPPFSWVRIVDFQKCRLHNCYFFQTTPRSYIL